MYSTQPAALEFGAGRTLTFEPRRLAGPTAFLVVWVVFWIVGNAAFFRQTAAAHAAGADASSGWELVGVIAFFVVWVSLWGLGGIAVVVLLLFQFAGHETARIVGDCLELRRAVGPAGRTRSYELRAIRDVRVLPGQQEAHQVAFSYESDTIWFGRRLDASAAEALAESLRAQLPPQLPVPAPTRALRKLGFTGGRLELRGVFGRVRTYDRTSIRNVRATPVVGEDGPSDTAFRVAFDHGRKTVEFGGNLTIGEAEALARHVREQLLLEDGTPLAPPTASATS